MKIGFIGLGTMGLPMAENIAKKYQVIGNDVIKRETSFPFVAKIEDLVNQVDVVISMVPKNEHVINVYQQVFKYAHEKMIFIDMSTISPEVSKNLALEAKKIHCSMLDCPVVKSQPAAIKGELGIYVGGAYQDFEQVKPILSCMGQNIIYMGDNGQGLLMKILHNLLVGEIQNGVNEILTIASKMQMNIDDVVQAISYGGGQNFYLDTKANNIKNNSYPTAFSIENMTKDVRLAKELMNSLNLHLDGVELVNHIYDQAEQANLQKEDFSATYKIVSKE
jgi:3-hydroxyisobutyrate dehydrogenase